MDRETLKLVDRFIAFGDVTQEEGQSNCYYLSDKAMQKVIKGYEEEISNYKSMLINQFNRTEKEIHEQNNKLRLVMSTIKSIIHYVKRDIEREKFYKIFSKRCRIKICDLIMKKLLNEFS